MYTETSAGKKYRKAPSHKKEILSGSERRRLLQLGASLLIFAVAFVGRNIIPERLSQLDVLLRQDINFQSAFSQFGQAVSQGEPILDTLGDLWVEVFAGGKVIGERNDVFSTRPSAIERLNSWDDPISVWKTAQMKQNIERNEQQNSLEKPVPSEPVPVEPTVTEPDPQTPEIQSTPLAVPLVQPSPEPAPAIETAVAQDADDQGKVLPASVSLQKFSLGLTDCTMPVNGVLSSEFGFRDHPASGEYLFHRGVDIAADLGEPIGAFAAGIVDCIGESDSSGLYIQLDHGNGLKTFYAHCSELCASNGETVAAGQTIAKVGETGNATGPHLHFAVIKDGIYLNPLFYIKAE